MEKTITDKVHEGEYEKNQKVKGVVDKITPLGIKVIFDGRYVGVLYHNEVFKKLEIGDEINVYIKKIREDLKVDLSLQPIGYVANALSAQEFIMKKLQEAGGTLNLSDKSSPDEIKATFGMSKKKFKNAIGTLYKQREIMIEKGRIVKV